MRAMKRSCLGVLSPTQTMSGFALVDGRDEFVFFCGRERSERRGVRADRSRMPGICLLKPLSQHLHDAGIAAVEEMPITVTARTAGTSAT